MLIIFDCDGVLVDSEFLATRENRDAYAEIGFDVSVDEFSSRFSGMNSRAVAREIADEIDIAIPETLFDDIETRVDEALANELTAINGVHEMLDKIDYQRCICSNSGTDRLTMMLKRTQLHDRFKPYIFSAREVGSREPKPSPSVFLHGASEFDVAPSDTIVIEDSSHGVQAAVAAGMRVIGFTGGAHTYAWHAEKLMEAGAETCVAKLTDVPAVIEAYKSWNGAL